MQPSSTGSSGSEASVIREYIENEIPGAGKITGQSSMGSSGWATSTRYDTEGDMHFFVKQARGEDKGMFRGEALGLQALYDTKTLRIPKVYHHGSTRSGTFIIMEYLEFGGRGSQAALGTALGNMHAAVPEDPHARSHFGFEVNNTIGGTPQDNSWSTDWVEFFRERRLRPQLEMTEDGELIRAGSLVMDNMDVLFNTNTESSPSEQSAVRPCVLHGDLWSGNIGTADGQPAVFDPAVYYGHSEAEFGMSWCAGFSRDFWSAYHAIIPKAAGFDDRAKLYRLYHYLNHYNLFGGGYRSSAMSEINSLKSVLGKR